MRLLRIEYQRADQVENSASCCETAFPLPNRAASPLTVDFPNEVHLGKALPQKPTRPQKSCLPVGQKSLSTSKGRRRASVPRAVWAGDGVAVVLPPSEKVTPWSGATAKRARHHAVRSRKNTQAVTFQELGESLEENGRLCRIPAKPANG